MKDFAETARALASTRVLCDHCLGRLWAKVERGLTNDERGRRLRGHAGPPPAECSICEALFDEIPEFVSLAVDALAPYEYRTYLVGTRIHFDVTQREAELVTATATASTWEPIHTELNREIGKRVGDLTKKPFDTKDPDITVVVDTRFNVTELQHGGLFLFGRYRKLERGIPQTIWPCRHCRGLGCDRCDGHGKMYPTSVQELVAQEALRTSGATLDAFHGAGREDVDARTLGAGRPFVLELKDPLRRFLDVAALERAINASATGRVEVEGLRLAEKREVVAVKESRGDKTYRARVAFDAEIPGAKLEEGCASLRGCAIQQRTPARVEHRRADLVRERRVHDVVVESATEREAVLRITGDAGLYIKELVSGDEGRTRPSLAERLGAGARVTELDVLGVEYVAPPAG
ncbi:MAG: tRNA pseudouridine(54/55) synthase Pus10 [Thermoplasmatota archaeon]